MAAAKDELANLDEAWEEPPTLAQAQPVTVSSVPPDLGDLDDGWNADSSALAAAPSGEPARGAKRASARQEASVLPAATWLTKRQRRELARQQRRHATERRAERKQARKLERREQARQRAAERLSSVVVRADAKDAEAMDVAATRAGRMGEVAVSALATSGVEARRGPASTRETERAERRPQRSVPRKIRRASERSGPAGAPVSAGQRRRTNRAVHLLVVAVVATFALWLWLR
ncbi:MAG: hypothetical protein JW940_22600 [Polyangiaceae bacterium]|nr:hypothetical protein [Polyangiaceae bacterium]